MRFTTSTATVERPQGAVKGNVQPASELECIVPDRVLRDPHLEPQLFMPRYIELTGLSRAACYQSVRRGEVPSIRVSNRIVIPNLRLREVMGWPLEGDLVFGDVK